MVGERFLAALGMTGGGRSVIPRERERRYFVMPRERQRPRNLLWSVRDSSLRSE
ncbi:MAG: hypothetical protein OHK0050_38590 [Roseiflexaceae bacterium]